MKGSRTKGFLEAGPYFESNRAKIRSYVQIPYTLLKGSTDGPTLCVTSGVHGTEYVGIAAGIKLANEIDPDQLHGKLIVVHVVDVPAFWERGYICPIDGVNVQGTWPGKSEGSIAYLITHRIFQEFISKADYYIDLHGGDVHESEIGFSLFHRTGEKKLDAQSEKMAKAFGFKYIIVSEGSSGAGCSFRVGPEHGIPTALCEFGDGDKMPEEEVDTVSKGLMNVMRHLKMLDGPGKTYENQRLVGVKNVGINSRGLFYTNRSPGDILEKGSVIGEVRDLEGKVVERIRAPSKLVLLMLMHNPLVVRGEKVAMYADLTKGAKIAEFRV